MLRSILLTLLVLVGVAGCNPYTYDSTYNFQLPHDLAHCQIIELQSGDAVGRKYIYLIKCPPGEVPKGYIGSSSTVNHGKYSISSAVTLVEGK